VKQKRINILFLTLFSWNALFGAVGGLVICIHQSLQVHAEVGQINKEECKTARVASEPSLQNLATTENCLDVELDAAHTVLFKTEHADFDYLISPLLIHETNFDFGLTLRELATDIQAQAPPALTAVSVHTVQLTQLRI
jgi:hypothetical protein